MRIKEINIKGLFGMFNHSILLNLEEHLTIIYGINGIGKTMLFKILDSFFRQRFDELMKSPFEKLIIIYENNSFFELLNIKSELVIKYFDKNNNILVNYKIDDEILKERVTREIESRFRISEVLENQFMLHKTNEILNYEEIYDRYRNILPDNLLSKIKSHLQIQEPIFNI